MQKWVKIAGNIEVCVCEECRWCNDAVIEAAEMLCQWPGMINTFLTSPYWYQRKGVKKYKEWREDGLA